MPRPMSHPPALLLALAAVLTSLTAAGARASTWSPERLDPKTYVSPSGRCRLLVDPSDSSGGGPARYRLTRRGEVLWSGQRPFTLWEAAVTDGGVVGGYAYDRGEDGWGFFHPVILDSRGKLRLYQPVYRDVAIVDGPTYPEGGTPMLQPELDRMILPVDLDSGRRWWLYRLSTGWRLGTLDPATEIPHPAGTWTFTEARVVPGTPLMLVEWWGRESEVQIDEALFTLVDADWRPVWRLLSPGGTIYPREGEPAEFYRQPDGILRSDQPHRFELRFVAKRQRVAFRVDRAADGGWSVRQEGHGPYEPFLDAQRAEAEFERIPVRRLPDLGSVELQFPHPPPGPESQPTPRKKDWRDDPVGYGENFPEAFYAGPDGRFYLTSRTGPEIYVFNDGGRLLGTPVLPDYQPSFGLGEPVFSTAERSVFVSGGMLLRNHPSYLFEVMLHGELRPINLPVAQSGNWLLDNTALTGAWLLQPSGRRSWAVGFGVVLAWMQPPGKIVRTWQRRPDRTWLRGIEAQAVAPDGGLAVLEGTYGAGAIVSLFSRDGRPIRRLDLPKWLRMLSGLAYDGKRVIVAGERGVAAFDRRGRPLWRFPLENRLKTEIPSWKPVVSPDGRELDLFDGLRTVYRYRLRS